MTKILEWGNIIRENFTKNIDAIKIIVLWINDNDSVSFEQCNP